MQALARILLLTLLGALLAGCVAEPVGSATPSPPFRSEAEAFAAAEASYRAYVDALNQVDLADPATFEAVYEWTTGEAEADSRELFSQMHADGWTVRGESSIVRIEHLEGAPDMPVIGVCLDVATVQVHDADGNSVVAPTRPDVQAIRVEFASASRSVHGSAVSLLVGYEPVLPC